MSSIFRFISVSKYYSKNKVGVNKLNFSIEENQATILIGKNGAGKTTTIKLMLGLLYTTEGKIEYSNNDFSYLSGNKKIGFLPELMYFPEQLTIKEFLINISRMRGISKKMQGRKLNTTHRRWGYMKM